MLLVANNITTTSGNYRVSTVILVQGYDESDFHQDIRSNGNPPLSA
jgi:hypothetical protein